MQVRCFPAQWLACCEQPRSTSDHYFVCCKRICCFRGMYCERSSVFPAQFCFLLGTAIGRLGGVSWAFSSLMRVLPDSAE